MTIRPAIQKLLTLRAVPPNLPLREEELINVSSATKRVAFAYERFRNTLEPDEEDILRRKAIFRILERRLDEDRPPQVSAIAVLQELIRAHYIKPLPHSYATALAAILVKVQLIDSRLPQPVGDWFLHVISVEIDRLLFPRLMEEALVHVMYEDVLGRAVWTDTLVAASDRDTQLYIACHRALFAADDFEIAYHYFTHYFPEWQHERVAESEATRLSNRLESFYKQLKPLVQHPARDRLMRLVRPTAVPYRLLRDMVRDNAAIFEGPDKELDDVVIKTLQTRMQRIRGRMGKRMWHSVLFLFITKTLIGVVIELPYEIIFLRGAHWLALAVNIVFHPVLLFFLSMSARLPGQKNSDRAVEQVRQIVTGEGELPTIVVSTPRSYGALTWSFFAIIYAVLFMGIFWGMFSVLALLDFSLVAMGIFVVFLGLVSFLSIRIRRSVDSVRVLPKREGAISAVVSFLSLPILEFGRWLAENISQVNVALFFMDNVLEAPFKLLIDVTEEWFSFVRDRREEIT